MKRSASVGVFSLLFWLCLIGLLVLLSCNKIPAKPSDVNPRDYQLKIHNDSVWLYDGEILVDRYVTKWNSKLDSIILKDNY